jgi:hypothetical protein
MKIYRLFNFIVEVYKMYNNPLKPDVKVKSQSHIATDGQSISKSWCRAPCGAHDQIFITL